MKFLHRVNFWNSLSKKTVEAELLDAFKTKWNTFLYINGMQGEVVITGLHDQP